MIDQFQIIKVVMTITRDKVSTNDVILNMYKRLINKRYELLSPRDQCRYYLKFNKVKGDVRYYAYIYNIIVNISINHLSLL